MPEVVEVTLTAMFLEDNLIGKNITDIRILGGRYSRHGLPGLSIFKKALPLKILEVNSYGKFMWFKLKGSNNKFYYILNTYGLEGEWGFHKQTHSGVEFELSDGRSLYFTDSRNFGTLAFTGIKKKLDQKLDMLGPDLLKTEFTNNEFYDRIKGYILDKNGNINPNRKDKKIIQILMDQTTKGGLGSGLGNYLAVEILYHAKISPHKTIFDLYNDKKLSNRLANSIRYITKLSFETADVGYLEHLSDDMASFIRNIRNRKNLYHKDTKLKNKKFMFNVYRKKQDPRGNPVKAEKDLVKGRTTYWSPSVQN